MAIARRRITEQGYDAMSIGDIAAEMEVSKAAIAYYFPTKDRFIDEFAAPVVDDLEVAVSDAGDDPATVLDAYLSVLIRHRDLAVWLDTDPAVARDSEWGDRLGAINEHVIAAITGRSRRKSDRLRALGVLGGVWRPARESSADELERHRADIVAAALDGYAATA